MKFGIFRIIGSELPPRDNLGARLKLLSHILNEEGNLKKAEKCFVLNSIYDLDYFYEIVKMVETFGSNYIVKSIDWKKYRLSETKNEKLLEAIAINKARNLAIEHSRHKFDFIIVLDGDCVFKSEIWNDICDYIESDQIVNSNRKYYSIPTSRCTYDWFMTKKGLMNPLGEPMLCFRRDAELRFDEKIPFGHGDKLKLLFKLGHSTEVGKHHILSHEKLCKSVGFVHHIGTGDDILEIDLKSRIAARNRSLNLLISVLDQKINYASKFL